MDNRPYRQPALQDLLQCALSSPHRDQIHRGKGFFKIIVQVLDKAQCRKCQEITGDEGNTELEPGEEPQEQASVTETLQRPKKLLSREGSSW